MTEKPKRKHPDSENNQPEDQKIEQFWTEHRITLIALEARFIHNKKPKEKEEPPAKNKKNSKKKDMQFEGGFTFPSQQTGKDNELNIAEEIKNSKFKNLSDLFINSEYSEDSGLIMLREFIKIMLELKHNSIRGEFLEIY